MAVRSYGLQSLAVWTAYLLLVLQPWNGDRLFYCRKRSGRTAIIFSVSSATGYLLSVCLVRSFTVVHKQAETAAAACICLFNADHSLWGCCGGIFPLKFFILKRRIYKNYLKVHENKLYCGVGVKMM